jgi:CheY-like chemotaxis protein
MGKPLVLLVDDEESILAVCGDALEAAGMRVTRAHTGAQAIWSAMADVPDVVVTDLRLRELSGWEVARRIRANARTRNVPIIALSGAYAPEDLKTQSEAAGFAACILKPASYATLVGTVHTVLNNRRAQTTT